MGSLAVTIKEEHLYQGSNKYKLERKVTFGDIEQVTHGTDLVKNDELGSGIELIRIVDQEEKQTAGSFVKGTVKYMRFTHISGSADGEIIFKKDDQLDGVTLEIKPKTSLIFASEQFAQADIARVVDPTYADYTYFSAIENLDVVKARGVGGDIKLEYVIAGT